MAVAILNTKEHKKELTFLEKLEATIDKSRRTCTLSEAMLKALVKLLEHELFNKNVYLTFASYYAGKGLTKLETYYNKRADEEDLHARWIMGYLNRCSAVYQMPKINEVNIEIKDMVHPFDITVDLEIYTTMCINSLENLAIQEHDLTTCNWLNGVSPETGKLILEQHEEETTSRNIAALAHIDTDWISKLDAILEYYESL